MLDDRHRADLAEVWRRVLAGEDGAAVVAEFKARDEAHRVTVDQRLAELRGEVDYWAAMMRRADGRREH